MDALLEQRLEALERAITEIRRDLETLRRNLVEGGKLDHRERQVIQRQNAAAARRAKKATKKRKS